MSTVVAGLGRFGDRRLEKGGPAFLMLWLSGRVACCGGWLKATGLDTSSFGAFCTTTR
jgi:hypothetical protein